MPLFKVPRRPFNWLTSQSVTYIEHEASSAEEAEAIERQRWLDNELEQSHKILQDMNHRRKRAGIRPLTGYSLGYK